MGLLPPAPTRRMFSLPHGSGTRPRMPCASTAASGTSSGCASSTWWPRTTATCRSRPCTAAGATRWAYRSATAPPGSGLGSRCTIGLLAERAVAPLSLSWALVGRRIGYLESAWGHGSYLVTRVSGRRGCAVSELARWPTRGFLSTRVCALRIALTVVCM